MGTTQSCCTTQVNRVHPRNLCMSCFLGGGAYWPTWATRVGFYFFYEGFCFWGGLACFNSSSQFPLYYVTFLPLNEFFSLFISLTQEKILQNTNDKINWQQKIAGCLPTQHFV